MKIRLRELRRIIRSVLLSEGAAFPTGLAIYLGRKDEIILYDPAVFFESLGPYLDLFKGQKVLRLREGGLKDGLLLSARWSMVGGI